MELTYKVAENENTNLKEILRSKFQVSDNLLTKLKKNNKIYVNSKAVYINEKLYPNDTVVINLDFEENSDNILPQKMDLKILFEDDCMIILDKPANMPVHPSILHYTDSLSNGVKYYFESINLKRKIRPVNRLDKDTSGIVIFAKNEYIQELLIKQMKINTFKKEYQAILVGNLDNLSGTINAPISRKENSIIEREINNSGFPSITHYELIKNYKDFCLVKFILETGRTHQIRVHSKYINHPILGDTLYGTSSNLISRQALHAYKISFIHPISKNNLCIISEIPDDMKKLIK